MQLTKTPGGLFAFWPKQKHSDGGGRTEKEKRKKEKRKKMREGDELRERDELKRKKERK